MFVQHLRRTAVAKTAAVSSMAGSTHLFLVGGDQEEGQPPGEPLGEPRLRGERLRHQQQRIPRVESMHHEATSEDSSEETETRTTDMHGPDGSSRGLGTAPGRGKRRRRGGGG